MSGRGDHPGWFAAFAVLAAGAAACLPLVVASFGGWVEAARDADRGTGAVAVARVSTPFVVGPSVSLERRRHPVRASAAGVPTLLVVPALQVRAPVVPVAATDGVLLPPSDPRVLGWWRAGAVPGAASGGALVTGHTVHTGGGAFDDLETLQRGDRVAVQTRRGTVRYVVSAVTIYRKATLAKDAQRVFSQSVPGRLVLVTCEDWDGSVYRSNVVVFADRASGST